MIRLRAVYIVELSGVADEVRRLLEGGAIAIEIDYDPEEP